MSERIIEYWLMDGRAWMDVDDAIVYEVCKSLKEARKNKADYGDAVICEVKPTEGKSKVKLIDDIYVDVTPIE